MRGWYLERKNRRQIGSLAYVEQPARQDSRGHQSLQAAGRHSGAITELVSVRLNGAACWCQVVDGATLGNRPRAARFFAAHGRAYDCRPLRRLAWHHLRRFRRAHQTRHRRNRGPGHGGGIGHAGDRNLAALFRSRAPVGVRPAHRRAESLCHGKDSDGAHSIGAPDGRHLRLDLYRPE